jgi:hypothetical protein
METTKWMTSDGEEPRYHSVTRPMVEEVVQRQQNEYDMEGMMSCQEMTDTIIQLLDPDNVSRELLSETIMYGLAVDNVARFNPIPESINLMLEIIELIISDVDDVTSFYCLKIESESE